MSKNLTFLLARLLLSVIFVRSLYSKILNFDGTLEAMETQGIPDGVVSALLLIGAMSLLAAGSLSLITGYKARFGAWLLIAFLLPVTLIFHIQPIEWISLGKNLGLLGGLLLITSEGAGRYSVGPD